MSLKTFFFNRKPYLAHISAVNRRHLVVMAAAAIPVSLLHIIFFLLQHGSRTGEKEIWWSIGIISAHTLLALSMILLTLAVRYGSHKGSSAFLIDYGVVPLILLIGVFISSIDQLVTPNITPYLVACTIAAVLFITSPVYTIGVYTAALLLFFYLLGIVQSDDAVLLSNRVNGITFTGIGIALSLILWSKHTTMINQKRHIKSQHEQLMMKNSQLEALASLDTLTGLYNRRKFDEITKEQAAGMNASEPYSIMVMDLDHFKRVNDRFGHLAGDRILAQTADLLRQHIHEGIILARWGGEEFIFALPGMGHAEAAAYAESIRNTIAEKQFLPGPDGQQLQITASFGVASTCTKHKNVLERCFREADEALYQAKAGGRNRVEAISLTS